MKTNMCSSLINFIKSLFGKNVKEVEETKATVQQSEGPTHHEEPTAWERCLKYDREMEKAWDEDKTRFIVVKSYSDEELVKLIDALYVVIEGSNTARMNDDSFDNRFAHYKNALRDTVKCLADDTDASAERLQGVLQVLGKAKDWYEPRYGEMYEMIKDRLDALSC